MARPVLFVDDSAFARATASRLFAERGVAVTAVGSSNEAAGVDPRSLSAALLDIDLGDGLGTDLAERLRDQVPELPVAFLTAGGSNLEQARRFGPVFLKSSEVEDAVSWISRLVTESGGGVG